MGLDRRSFLQVSALAGGGLLCGFQLGDPLLAEGAKPGFRPNAWLRMDKSGHIIFTLDRTEMGQGVYTGLTTILAEELDIDPEALVVEAAPFGRVYGNTATGGVQMTGGSSSISGSYLNLRQAGATLRVMMVSAAATLWKVEPNTCETVAGVVHHHASGQKLSYAELASEVARQPIPDAPALKDPANFRLIGKTRKRLDAGLKVNGQAVFGIDVKIPDLRVAVLVRSPRFGARVDTLEDAAARSVAGVEDIVKLEQGVAVVARNYWQARKASELLVITWQGGSKVSSPIIFEEFKAEARDRAESLFKGSVAADQLPRAKILEADYWVPYAAHATMEPMNCTVSLKEKSCEIWAPSQSAGLAMGVARSVTGLKEKAIKIHTTFIGGGFGRRLAQDYVEQALLIAKEVKKPIKLIWSREEDMQHDFYRPASYHALRAAVDEQGQILSWQHAIVGPSILAEVISDWLPAMLPTWMPDFLGSAMGSAAGGMIGLSNADPTSSEGASDHPYAAAVSKTKFVRNDPGIPIGFWRSVGHSFTGFVVESAIDELAHLAQKDPMDYRRKLLESSPRHLEVLTALERLSNWRTPAGNGLARGLAIHESFGSVCGQVVELRVEGQDIKVEKVFCVIDCGRVINPMIVEDQMVGSIIFGLSAALKAEITFKNGEVEQTNFHDYPPLRSNEIPFVVVETIASENHPSGVGEPGVPPIAAAVANAVFVASGQRLRHLPLRLASS